MKILFGDKKNYYKANMHCHSTWSDGTHSPEELKELYKAHGYSILSITDHEGLFDHSDLNDDDFILIPGYELENNLQNTDNYNLWKVSHLCIYKKDFTDLFQLGYDAEYNHPAFRWIHNDALKNKIIGKGEPFKKEYSHEYINGIIKKLRENGFIVTYNHPTWSMEQYPDYIQYSGMNNMEIFNFGNFMRGYDEHNGKIYDDLLRKGERIGCVAADDCHWDVDMFGGFIVFNEDSLNITDIMNDFECGNFYASTGPELESIAYDNNEITVKAKKPCKYIRFLTDIREARIFKFNENEAAYEASFKLCDDIKYVRCEVVGFDGERAYTKAYFSDELI